MIYVYVLYSSNIKNLYKGKTRDLKKRLHEHNLGKVKSTKAGRPWVLVHYQAFVNQKDAVREELFLKSGKGKERLKILLQETLERLDEVNKEN